MPARAKAKPRVGVRRSQPPRPTGRLALYGIHALDTPCPQTMEDSQRTATCYNPGTSSPRTGTTRRNRNSMQSPTRLNAHGQAKLPSTDLGAITLQLEELKQVGPEWDGPCTITPEPDVVDRTAVWLTEHWRAELGTPDICPTADGGVSISWEWGAVEPQHRRALRRRQHGMVPVQSSYPANH